MSDEEESSSTWASTEGISAYFVLFSALLALVLVLSKILHDRPVLSSIFPEAGLIIIVGMIAGAIVTCFIGDTAAAPEGDDDNAEGVAQSLLGFSPNVFFIALLPPIIFNSGYHLRRELFFRHLLPIILFAVIGTIISALVIAFFLDLVVGAGLTSFQPTMTELLTFGALISATDPVSTLAVFQAKRVDPHLFYLVFGESVLNDAVGLVLFKAFSKFVVPENGAGKIVMEFGEFILAFSLDAIGSPVLGLFCGVASAFLFKYVDMRGNKLLELSLYILIMYVPFLLAEMAHLSGIVTILFTGMAAKSFIVPNLSEQTADTAESLFRLAAHLAETSIFLELGLSVFGLKGSFNATFILWSLMACLLARAVNIYPVTICFNRALRRDPHTCADLADATTVRRPIPKSVHASHVEMTDALAHSDHHESETMFHDDDKHIVRNETDLSSVTPKQARDLKIKSSTAHMLWFSGLRGAVAYACARSFPNTFGHQNEFVLTTMVIVLVTVFLLGSTTELMLNALKIDMNVDEERYMEDWHQQRQSDGMILRFEELVNHHAVRDQDEDEPAIHPMTPAHHDSDHHLPVEMTASRHFAHAEEMGYERHKRKKGSLFDFGGAES